MSTLDATSAAPPTTKQKVGLALAGCYCLTNVPSVLVPTADGEVGPPTSVLLVCSVMGVLGVVAMVVAWRTGSPAAMRVLAASVVLILLTALPAFFVEVPALVKTGVAASLVWGLVALVLVFSGRGDAR
jgi:hypothetical protein